MTDLFRDNFPRRLFRPLLPEPQKLSRTAQSLPANMYYMYSVRGDYIVLCIFRLVLGSRARTYALRDFVRSLVTGR